MKLKCILLVFVCVLLINTQAQISTSPIVPSSQTFGIPQKECYFNIYAYNVGGASGTSTINYQHENLLNSNLFSFESIQVYVVDNNTVPITLGSITDPGSDIITAGGNLVGEHLSSGGFQLMTSFSIPNINTGLGNNYNLNNGDVIYIVEHFCTLCANTNQTIGGDTHISFGGNNTHTNNFEPDLLISGIINTSVSEEIPSYYTNLSAQVNTLTVPNSGMCTNPYGNEIARKFRINIDGTTHDPVLYMLFGGTASVASLIEVDPGDLLLRFHLVTKYGVFDSPGLIGGEYINLEDLVGFNSTSSSSQNIFFRDDKRYDSSSGLVSSNASTELSSYVNGFSDPIPNWVPECASLSSPFQVFKSFISFNPSLANPSAFSIPTLSYLNFKLSNLNISDNSPNLDITDHFYNGEFMTLEAGSFIEIEYKAHFTPQDNFATGWEHLSCTHHPLVYTQIGLHGCDECTGDENAVATINNDAGTGIDSYQHLATDGAVNSSGSQVAIMLGDADFNPITWDGDVVDFLIDPDVIQWNHINKSSLSIDPACSHIEFVVDFEQGLGVPCPGPSITGVSIDPAVPGFGSVCNGGVANATELFYIDLGNGTEIGASSVDVVVLPNMGQRWTIRMPLTDFYGNSTINSVIPGNYNHFDLPNTRIHMKVQAYCPSLDLPVPYNIKSYLVPGKCLDALGNDSYQFQSISDSQYGTNYYPAASCSPGGNCYEDDLCQSNRFLIGMANGEMPVTCPGCVTAGALLTPNNVAQLRHIDFIGYADTDDDGIAENLANLATNEADRSQLRHGDVMTISAKGKFFNGEALLPDGTQYTVADLANPNAITNDCTGNPPNLNLQTYALEIGANGPDAEMILSSMFCPLIKDAQVNGHTLEHNGDIANDEYSKYTDLADTYASEVNITYSPPVGATVYLGTITLTDDHVVWANPTSATNPVFRIAIGVNEINSLASFQALNLPDFAYFSNSLELDFTIHFLTDVDVHPRNWTQVWGPIAMDFTYEPYGIGASVSELLGLTSGTPLAYYDPQDFCDATTNRRYMCEGGAGKISIVPYVEDRVLNGTYNLGYIQNYPISISDFSAADNISPCAQGTYSHNYRSGNLNRGGGGNVNSSPNFFPNEIRQPALPEEINLYIPEPFNPEGIRIKCSSLLAPLAYGQGTGQGRTYTAYIPIDLSGGPNPFGITISTETMPVGFEPKYPANLTGLYGPSASGIPGDNIFDPTTNIQHTRIRIPIEALHDPSLFTQLAYHANDLNLLPNTNSGGFPVFIADEFLQLQFVVAYGMPNCNQVATGSEDHSPYNLPTQTDENIHYAENHSPIYYDGKAEHLLTLFGDGTEQMLYPWTATQSTLSPADFATAPYFHPGYDTPLALPICLKTHEVYHPGLPAFLNNSSISGQVEGVDNHPINFDDYLSNNTLLEDLFSGAFPASSSVNMNHNVPLPINMPHLYFDQRNQLSVDSYITNNTIVNTQTGEFSFQFNLKDHVFPELQPFAAPCGLLDNLSYANFDAFFMATGVPVLPGIGVDDMLISSLPMFKRNSTIDNLYFYLEDNSGLVPNIFEDVLITEVSKNLPTPSTQNFGLGAEAINLLTGDPNLFHLGSVSMASVNYGIVVNETDHLVTVKGVLNCDNLDVEGDLSGNGVLNLPFNVVVNYNCDKGFEAYRQDNYSLFDQEQLATNGNSELTFDYIADTRCDNDSLEDFDLEIHQVLYSVQINDITTDPCHPLFEVEVINLLGGEIQLDHFSFSGLPPGIMPAFINQGWSQSQNAALTYTNVINLSSAGNAGVQHTFMIDFGNGNCIENPFTFNLEMNGIPYCHACNTSTPCTEFISLTAQGQFNFGINNGASNLIDFTNYDAFTNSPCITGINNGLITIDLTDLPPASENYELFFTISDGINSCDRSYLWTSGTLLDQVVFDISACNLIDLCNLTVFLNSVVVEIDCETPCGVINATQFSTSSCHSQVTSQISLTETACETYTSLNGNVYTSSGIYTEQTSNIATGCTDYIIDLTIYDPISINNPGSQKACDEYYLSVITGTNLSGDEAYYDDSQVNGGTLVTGPITSSQTIWIYATNGPCTAEESFFVGIISTVLTNHPSVIACSEYIIPTGLGTGQTITTTGIYSFTSGLPNCEEEVWNITINSNPIASVFSTTPVICFGDANGTVFIAATGTGPFEYTLLDGSPNQPTNQLGEFGGLIAGLYNVLVTDLTTGCTTTVQFSITGPTSPLHFGQELITHYCDGEDDLNGAIDITIMGGYAPYTYTWSNGAATEDLIGFAAGTYTVSVLDANGCEVSATYTIIDLNVNNGIEPCFEAYESNCGIFNFINQLTDLSSNPAIATTVEWTIEDGSSPPIIIGNMWDINNYTLPVLNAYQVCLTVTNTIIGSDGTPQECSYNCCQIISPCSFDCEGQVQASFNSTFTTGNSIVSFINTSTSNGGIPIGNVEWIWGDGQIDSYPYIPGIQPIYEHQYGTSGFYEVCLIVHYKFPDGTICSDTSCRTIAHCNAKANEGCANVNFQSFQSISSTTVSFSSQVNPLSFNVNTYQWHFGDPLGGTSNLANPIYTYPFPGTLPLNVYDVTLIVSGQTENGEKCMACISKKIKVKSPDKKDSKILDLLIVPNPSKGNVQLVSFLKLDEYVNVLVKDSRGKMIHMESKAYSESIGLNLSVYSLPPGVYIVELVTSEGIISKKMVIGE